MFIVVLDFSCVSGDEFLRKHQCSNGDRRTSVNRLLGQTSMIAMISFPQLRTRGDEEVSQ